MRGHSRFFDINDRLKRLSDLGDQLETFRSAMDFQPFRPELNAAKIGMANLVYNIKRLICLRNLAIA
jgi:hypothetical protein